MPLTVPNVSVLNWIPSSTDCVSPESSPPGVTLAPQIEHGQATLTPTCAGAPMLPLSSVARARIVADGAPCATHVYVQFVVPVAGCHVPPPSVETSMPATTP